MRLAALIGKGWPSGALPGTGEPATLGRRVQTVLWLLLVGFAFFGVFGHSLWGANDAREGGMIWDMYRHGTWVTPTINGIPFLEKPPLLHWTGLLICHAAGRITEGLVRLPAALFGFGTLVLIYFFIAGAPASGETRPGARRQLAAWAAVFLCATAIEFQEYSRVVLTDIALTFVVIVSLFLFWRAFNRPGALRWAAFLFAAAGAFYAKGFIGPALIWAAVGVFLVWNRRFRLLAALAAAYVPIAVAVVLPWAVELARLGGEPMVRFVFWDNQFGRFFRFGDPSLPHDPFFINKEPLTYYLLNLPLYLAPWTLLVPPAIVAWARRSSPFREPLHVYLASSAVGMSLLLEASSAKVVNYALPIYPFLFMIVAIWLVDLAFRPHPSAIERSLARLTAWGAVALCVGTPLLYAAALVARPEVVRTGGTASSVGSLLLAAGVLAFAVAAAVVLRNLARSGGRPLAAALAPAAYALAAMGILQLVTPPMDRGRSFEPIASLAAEQAREGRTLALASGEYRDVGAFTFYLDQRLRVLGQGEDVAAFLADPEPRAVIAPVAGLPALRPLLADIPHQELMAGSPHSLSRTFVLLVNRPGEDLGGGAVAGGDD